MQAPLIRPDSPTTEEHGLGWILAVVFACSACAACREQGVQPGAPGGSASLTPARAAAAPEPSAIVAPPAPPPVPPPPPGARIEDEQNTIAVFARVAPSTVFVTQKRIVVDYFRRRAVELESGSGSGFVWDQQGHIVTNWHVIRGARSLTVTLRNRETYPARLVGAEPRKDVAVLLIQAPAASLVPVVLPPEDSRLEVGQKAVAIGNPFGLDHTLTTGVVSALGREVDGAGGVTIRGMIQIDAAINPGNSGGPLLDSSGRLMGMNTMIFSQSGAWAGIGFAVPVDTVRRVVTQLVQFGRVQEVGLGFVIDPAGRIERAAGVRGVAVITVPSGSPAERAGVRGLTETMNGFVLGDVIVAIAGERIEDYDDLYNFLDSHRPGERLEVTLFRDRATREVELEVVLAE
ncbi:MAG: trypsin-like peptidase domain-containing protein [Polyangiaceae bacterium]|nr:trypsin-like peptidase domain-containing protein [Polyangiaceae bacterium]